MVPAGSTMVDVTRLAVSKRFNTICQFTNYVKLTMNSRAKHLPCAMAYLGHGRHGTCHERHFNGDAKIVWQQLNQG